MHHATLFNAFAKCGVSLAPIDDINANIKVRVFESGAELTKLSEGKGFFVADGEVQVRVFPCVASHPRTKRPHLMVWQVGLQQLAHNIQLLKSERKICGFTLKVN